jgi:hypothetical protein
LRFQMDRGRCGTCKERWEGDGQAGRGARRGGERIGEGEVRGGEGTRACSALEDRDAGHTLYAFRSTDTDARTSEHQRTHMLSFACTCSLNPSLPRTGYQAQVSFGDGDTHAYICMRGCIHTDARRHLHVLDPEVRLRHHEMDVEEGLAMRLEALDNGGTP